MHTSSAGTILIVDDELAHQRILAQILGAGGYTVLCAASGAAAHELLRATSPDLLILDVALPDTSGHTLCRALRCEPGLAETPIIFISAAHTTASKVAAFSEGAVDYIDKPFYAAEVLARVRAHITLHRLQQHLAERTAALQQANERLARALMAKDASLTGVSHELRSPLNTVLGVAQMLRDDAYGALDEQQRAAVELISASGEHLLSLINDLLDLAKIEAGREELSLAFVNPAELAIAAQNMVRPGALAAGVDLVTPITPDLPLLYADRRRVVQILLNLLVNGLRFTPSGGQIGLEVAPCLDGEGVRFTVWDTGPGIPLEQQGRLFRAFAQLEGQGRAGGTGLGLALVGHLARMHGGGVALESVPGAGCRFSVTLPSRPPGPAAEAPSALAAESPLALIIDEYGPNAEGLAAMLREAGYRCVVAPDLAGAAAVDPAAVAVTLLALPMADYRGEETLPRLRAGPLGATPLVAIGAVLLAGSGQQALRAGADAYLPRPLAAADLLATLARLGLPVTA